MTTELLETVSPPTAVETSDEPSDPQFGDWVRVSAVLERAQIRMGFNQVRKYWQRRMLNTPRLALLIGWRTLSDGIRSYEDEAGFVYAPQQHYRATMVVFHPRGRPVLVPADAIQQDHPRSSPCEAFAGDAADR